MDGRLRPYVFNALWAAAISAGLKERFRTFKVFPKDLTGRGVDNPLTKKAHDQGRAIMPYPCSPSPLPLPVPGICYCQNIRVDRDALEWAHSRGWLSASERAIPADVPARPSIDLDWNSALRAD